jgi:DNA-binding MarR family transcriptional regulator
MVTSSTLSPQIIGQAERALGALMNRVLTATGGTFPEWVALTITVGGDAGDHERLVERLAEALGVDAWAASAIVSELIESDLLRTVPGSGQHLILTERGQDRYGRIRAAIDDVIGRLFGDATDEDLATAGRVLSLVTARARAELAEAWTLA